MSYRSLLQIGEPIAMVLSFGPLGIGKPSPFVFDVQGETSAGLGVSEQVVVIA